MKIGLALIILVSTCAYAQERDHGHERRCSNATLKGSYGFTIAGTRPTGPPPAPVENFIGLAITNFDGNGGLTQTYGTSHGSILGDSSTDVGSGTYEINPDCSGTATLNLAGHGTPVSLRLWVLVVEGGDQINLVVMTPTPNGNPVPAWNLTAANGKKIKDTDGRF
jgi:hypothetical protein